MRGCKGRSTEEVAQGESGIAIKGWREDKRESDFQRTTKMASVPVYCLCQLPYDATRFMIECDLCQQWFHGSCVGVEEEKSTSIDIYHCPNCEILHGPSVMKKHQGTPVGQNLIENKEVDKVVQTESPRIIHEQEHRRIFHSNKKATDFTQARSSKTKARLLNKAQPKLRICEKFDLDSKGEPKIEEIPQREKVLPTKKKLPKFHRKLLQTNVYSNPKRIQEQGEREFDIEKNYATDQNIEEGVEAKLESTGATCGILDLLKASRQIGGPVYIGHNKTPVSPGTLEAIQGMLCMANVQPVSSLPPASSFQKGDYPPASQEAAEKQNVKQGDNHNTNGEKEEVNTHEPENLEKCFQDEDYIYLEPDEDDSTLKLRQKKKKKKSSDDVPWIPKARVAPSFPKPSRPVREGTVVSSMETRLTDTVAKLAQQEPSSSILYEYTTQPKIVGMSQVNENVTPMAPGVFLSQQCSSLNSPSEDQIVQGKRPKKGLATAKQRLGRILKIHRHGKLIL